MTGFRVLVAICTATLVSAAPAYAFLQQIAQFGSPGSASGQFQTPVGIAVDQRSGKIYVADSANARIEKFSARGKFVSAWGWGVADGAAASEVCTSKATCQAGIAGPGGGQLSNPTSIAVDTTKRGPSSGDLYVGDAGNNVVVKFAANGKYLATIDGSTTPQGPFTGIGGVAVDQSGNLWVADRTTNNVTQFDGAGNFVQQWNDGFFSQTIGIAVDATNDAVYLLDDLGATQRFTLNGGDQTTIDQSTTLIFSAGLALALDPATGNLYVDHGDHVVVYDRTATQIDTLSLGATINSQGLAFRGGRGSGRRDRLYVADENTDLVTVYGPPGAGAPAITSETATSNGKTSVTLKAAIVPLGRSTSCTFQYVDNTGFQASGYAGATSVACTPDPLGTRFGYEHASATISGLTLGAVYHFRVVATSSAGTTTGDDAEFQVGPGNWAPFFRCPVDDPAMLATDDVNTQGVCLGANATHGSFTIGSTTTLTGNTNLQVGVIEDLNTGLFTVVGSASGALVADPAQVTVSGITVTATVESAGVPSNFDLFAGISVGAPIITVPIKIHLTGGPVDLGPSCFIGSEAEPIVLTLQNIDMSNATVRFGSFDLAGNSNLIGPMGIIAVNGAVQADDTFAVPAAHGCGPNADGSVDATIDALVGLPSPSGSNHLLLQDASSAVGFANGADGATFSSYWHGAFD